MVDLASGASAHALVGHREEVLCGEWVPGREFQLATGGVDTTVRLWDIRRSGESACLATLDMNDGMCRGFRAGAGGTSGASRGDSGISGGRSLFSCVRTNAAAAAAANPAFIATMPRLRTRAPVSLRSVAPTQAHNGAVLALRFSSDGQFLVTIGDDRRLRMWRPCQAATAAPGDDILPGAVQTFEDSAAFSRKRLRSQSQKKPLSSGRHRTAVNPGGYVSSGVHFPALARREHGRLPVSMQNALCVVQPCAARDARGCFVAVPEGGLSNIRGTRRRGPGGDGRGGGSAHATAQSGSRGGGQTGGVLALTNDARISIFGTLTGRRAHSLRAHLGEVTAVAFMDVGGPELLSGSRDGQILLWRPAAKTMIAVVGDLGLEPERRKRMLKARRPSPTVQGARETFFSKGLKPDIDYWSD